MDDLIEALQIGNPRNPTNCDHDELTVCIQPKDVSEEDTKRLNELGFHPDREYGEYFKSYRFGSA